MHRFLTALYEDHANTGRLLDAVQRQRDRVLAGGETDFEILLGAVAYCRDFPALHHHPHEESLLARLGRVDPDAAEALGDLALEHAVLTAREAELAQVLERVRNDMETERAAFVHLLDDFVAAHRDHMAREERLLFAPAEARLARADWQALERQAARPSDPLAARSRAEAYRSLRRYVYSLDAEAGEAGEAGAQR